MDQIGLLRVTFKENRHKNIKTQTKKQFIVRLK